MLDSRRWARLGAVGLCLSMNLASSATAQPSGGAWADLGIVVNETFTPMGQEFYRRFTDYWRENPDFERYTLVVSERPSRRSGNRIAISQDQQVVFTGNLPIKLEAIRALSADASEKVNANILSLQLGLSNEPDRDIAPRGF